MLLAVAATLSLAWNIATAPLQGPDERDHVAYAAHLGQTGSVPSPDIGTSPYGADEGLALFSLNLAAIAQNPLARPDWSDSQVQPFEEAEGRLTSQERAAGTGANPVARNPPLYYAAEAAAWRLTPGGFFARLFTMRLLSGLMLLAAVAFTWLLAGEVFRRRLAQTVATAFVALTPMSGFLGGIVNPDIASLAIWAAFLWLALRTVRLGPTPGRTALLALAAVAGVLTHGRNLPIVVLLVVALATAWIYNRSPFRELLKGAASAGATALAGVVAFTLISSSSAGGNYGGVANLNNTAAFKVRQFLSSIWQFYLPKLSSMEPRIGPDYGYRQMFIEQFLGGDFASHEVFLPYSAYDLTQLVTGVAAVALYTVLVLNWRTLLARWPSVVILGSAAAGLLLFLHLASYRNLLGGGDPLITGRYLLPIAPVIGVGLGAVISGLPRRWSPTVAGALIGAMFFVALAAVTLSFERFYA